MRKIPAEYENPIDNFFIDISEKVSPAFRAMKMTPNAITFMSLIFGILSIYCLYTNHIIAFSIFYLISYFFDCLDGYYARKYKMTSKFGDYFDHIKDVLVFIGLLVVFIIKFRKCMNWYSWVIIGVIMTIATFGMLRQLGCQEIWYSRKKKSESESLSFNTKFCKNVDVEKEMKKQRWLGCGVFTIITILVTVITFYRCK